jgi:hypothetical protein
MFFPTSGTIDRHGSCTTHYYTEKLEFETSVRLGCAFHSAYTNHAAGHSLERNQLCAQCGFLDEPPAPLAEKTIHDEKDGVVLRDRRATDYHSYPQSAKGQAVLRKLTVEEWWEHITDSSWRAVSSWLDAVEWKTLIDVKRERLGIGEDDVLPADFTVTLDDIYQIPRALHGHEHMLFLGGHEPTCRGEEADTVGLHLMLAIALTRSNFDRRLSNTYHIDVITPIVVADKLLKLATVAILKPKGLTFDVTSLYFYNNPACVPLSRVLTAITRYGTRPTRFVVIAGTLALRHFVMMYWDPTDRFVLLTIGSTGDEKKWAEGLGNPVKNKSSTNITVKSPNETLKVQAFTPLSYCRAKKIPTREQPMLSLQATLSAVMTVRRRTNCEYIAVRSSAHICGVFVAFLAYHGLRCPGDYYRSTSDLTITDKFFDDLQRCILYCLSQFTHSLITDASTMSAPGGVGRGKQTIGKICLFRDTSANRLTGSQRYRLAVCNGYTETQRAWVHTLQPPLKCALRDGPFTRNEIVEWLRLLPKKLMTGKGTLRTIHADDAGAGLVCLGGPSSTVNASTRDVVTRVLRLWKIASNPTETFWVFIERAMREDFAVTNEVDEYVQAYQGELRRNDDDSGVTKYLEKRMTDHGSGRGERVRRSVETVPNAVPEPPMMGPNRVEHDVVEAGAGEDCEITGVITLRAITGDGDGGMWGITFQTTSEPALLSLIANEWGFRDKFQYLVSWIGDGDPDTWVRYDPGMSDAVTDWATAWLQVTRLVPRSWDPTDLFVGFPYGQNLDSPAFADPQFACVLNAASIATGLPAVFTEETVKMAALVAASVMLASYDAHMIDFNEYTDEGKLKWANLRAKSGGTHIMVVRALTTITAICDWQKHPPIHPKLLGRVLQCYCRDFHESGRLEHVQRDARDLGLPRFLVDVIPKGTMNTSEDRRRRVINKSAKRIITKAMSEQSQVVQVVVAKFIRYLAPHAFAKRGPRPTFVNTDVRDMA